MVANAGAIAGARNRSLGAVVAPKRIVGTAVGWGRQCSNRLTPIHRGRGVYCARDKQRLRRRTHDFGEHARCDAAALLPRDVSVRAHPLFTDGPRRSSSKGNVSLHTGENLYDGLPQTVTTTRERPSNVTPRENRVGKLLVRHFGERVAYERVPSIVARSPEQSRGDQLGHAALGRHAASNVDRTD